MRRFFGPASAGMCKAAVNGAAAFRAQSHTAYALFHQKGRSI